MSSGIESQHSKMGGGDELIAEARPEVVVLPSDMPPWMRGVIARLDALSRFVGHVVCWLVVPIFMAMVYEIVARKFFTAPTIWAFDVSRMLYGALFMLGSGYALMRGVHIRADFLYRTLPARAQGMIDATLYVLLFFPSMVLFLYVAGEYAYEAWERGERMDDTPWQPFAWPIRAAMFVSVLFLILQGISEVLKSAYAVWKGRWPHEQ